MVRGCPATSPSETATASATLSSSSTPTVIPATDAQTHSSYENQLREHRMRGGQRKFPPVDPQTTPSRAPVACTRLGPSLRPDAPRGNPRAAHCVLRTRGEPYQRPVAPSYQWHSYLEDRADRRGRPRHGYYYFTPACQ